MFPYESRILWCVLEGDPKPYDTFDIRLGANVSWLKAAIKQRIECLHGINADRLQLRKLSATVPIDPDHTLAQRLAALGNIASCSRALSCAEEVAELFPEPHSRKHLHILVQHPEILASSSSSTSRKRSRSLAEEDGPAAKRKEIEDHCVAIHEAIKAMPDNLDLSDPSTFTTLPFPSLLPMPTQRFTKTTTTMHGINRFEYMGRSQFRELQKRVEEKKFLEASESLFLYGTSGSGKSHLLAALVYHLIREGKRVVYIPSHYSSLGLAPAETIWIALNLAFYDSAVLRTIGDRHNVDTLIHFMSKHRDLYVIVDQVNALETTGNDIHREGNVQGLHWLDTLRFNHRYICSASANEKSNREIDWKQSEISVFWILGGMSKDETDQWFTHHGHQIPRLSTEQRQCVEYLTGCIPLLLRCLFDVKNFVEVEFRNISDLRRVNSDVDIFFTDKFDSLPSLGTLYLTIMKECVRGDPVTVNDQSLYDLRYFYIDEKGIGRFTCGLALEAMMSILHQHDNTLFLDDLWYAAVSRSDNPVVQGFLAKQVCLNNIATNGLKAVHPQLGPMSTSSYLTQPSFNNFLSSDDKICLYAPTNCNFMAVPVDGVILLLDRPSKQATMFSIRFTLSQSHKQSDTEFHSGLWPTWMWAMTSAGFSVKSIFVWIGPWEYVTVEPELVKELRSGDKVVHPEYSVVHVGVEMVDARLASALGIKQ